MPHTFILPSRTLNCLLLVFSVAIIGPTAALSSVYGEESTIRFVEPFDCVQPASHELSFQQLGSTLESIFEQATTLPIRIANLQPIDLSKDQTELPSPSDGTEVVATPNQEKNVGSRCHPSKPLSSMSTDISLPAGSLPNDFAAQCAATEPSRIDRRMLEGWAMTNRHWAATCLRHRPLYFEEINAERYGYTASYCLQPLISAGRFFLTIPALPYKMAIDGSGTCTYTLGHYRPGSCAPWRRNRLPLKAAGAIVQVGAVAALLILIP